MSTVGQTVGDAAASAVDFARDAARRLWGVQALCAFGLTLVFISLRGQLGPGEALDLWIIGWTTALASAAPLWAGLYRLELGGAAARDLGPGGVQFGKAELRLLGLAVAFFAAAALAWLPVVAVSALIFVVFRGLGQVVLGPLGGIQVSFLIVMLVWLAAAGLFGWACARMAFAPAATIGKRRLVVQEAWELGREREKPLFLAWILAQAPALLAVVLLALMDSLEAQAPTWAVRDRWPLTDAAIAGLALGFVVAVIQVPLTVGVLGYLYRLRREHARVLTAPREPDLEAELLAG